MRPAPVSLSRASWRYGGGFRRARSKMERPEAPRQEPWTEELAQKYNSVPIADLLDDPAFFGAVGGQSLWPENRSDILELFHLREKEGVCVFLDEEGIGSGKTTKGAAILACLLYYAVTDWNFRRRFRLDDNSEIALLMGSRKEAQSREVTFQKFLPYCSSPFFLRYFPPNYRREDFDPATVKKPKYPRAVRFPGHFYVFPITKNVLDVLGWDIYAATLDEANFLEMAMGSAQEREERMFDAASVFFDQGMERIRSRFSYGGRVYGQMNMISSRRYTDSFLTRAIRLERKSRAEGLRYLPPSMIRSRCTWQAQPVEKIDPEYVVVDILSGEIVGEGVRGDGKYENADGLGVY